MSSFFIGAKNRVLKGKAAPKGKGGKGRVFPREKPYPERVKGYKRDEKHKLFIREQPPCNNRIKAKKHLFYDCLTIMISSIVTKQLLISVNLSR